MTSARPVPYPELPIDVVDATGLLGALSGVLSVLLPFFLGLTVALGAMLLSAGLLRRIGGSGAERPDEATRRRYWIGFGVALLGWTFVLAHPALADRFLGATLGSAGLPLWSIARRPLPFGGR
jgi:hypothetical protein